MYIKKRLIPFCMAVSLCIVSVVCTGCGNSAQTSSVDNTAAISATEAETQNLDDFGCNNLGGGKGEIFQYVGIESHITIPTQIKDMKIVRIAKNAFYGKSLREVTFETGTEEIGEQAFANNKKLATLVLPDTLKKVNEKAFNGCEGITELVLPESVVIMYDSAFGDTSITSVVIPKNVKTLYPCFRNCSKLKEITIPSTVTEIDNEFFTGIGNDVTVITSKGSAADKFCQKKNVTVKYE